MPALPALLFKQPPGFPTEKQNVGCRYRALQAQHFVLCLHFLYFFPRRGRGRHCLLRHRRGAKLPVFTAPSSSLRFFHGARSIPSVASQRPTGTLWSLLNLHSIQARKESLGVQERKKCRKGRRFLLRPVGFLKEGSSVPCTPFQTTQKGIGRRVFISSNANLLCCAQNPLFSFKSGRNLPYLYSGQAHFQHSVQVHKVLQVEPKKAMILKGLFY